MRRKYPDHPIVGVGGVVFLEDKVLLVKRGREPGFGDWSIPGGAVDTGETLKEAVVREVREETGLDVEVLALAKVLERIFRDPEGRVAYHYILVDFLCRPCGGLLQAGTDAADARFVPVTEMGAYKIAPVTLAVIHRSAWMRDNPGCQEIPESFGLIYG
ncbi:MAG TPA: NUDIX hydrolase [Thermodesulfobacteriota bacterium]|nr:NUDIX hydrolase [Thermodesulfobacteriota bacterium]